MCLSAIVALRLNQYFSFQRKMLPLKANLLVQTQSYFRLIALLFAFYRHFWGLKTQKMQINEKDCTKAQYLLRFNA